MILYCSFKDPDSDKNENNNEDITMFPISINCMEKGKQR